MEQWASVPSKRQGPGFRVKLSEAGAFLSLSLPICRFIILCPFHSVESELAHSINLFSSYSVPGYELEAGHLEMLLS